MVKESRILIFIIGVLCTYILFSAFSRKVSCQSITPSSLTFTAASDVIYFFDRENAKIYRYNTQGRLTRTYILKELGKELVKARK